jgi:ABC-type phosphate transport system, permease component
LSSLLILSVLIILIGFGHILGRQRASHAVSGNLRNLHSLPNFYGLYVALWAGIPAVIALCLWLILQPVILDQLLVSSLSEQYKSFPEDKLGLLLNDVKNIADGNISSRRGDPSVMEAANRLNDWRHIGSLALFAVVIALCLGCLIFARRRISPKLRARISVERVFNIFLLVCSLIAIITTVGIVLSLLFETIRFFGKVPLQNFFST